MWFIFFSRQQYPCHHRRLHSLRLQNNIHQNFPELLFRQVLQVILLAFYLPPDKFHILRKKYAQLIVFLPRNISKKKHPEYIRLRHDKRYLSFYQIIFQKYHSYYLLLFLFKIFWISSNTLCDTSSIFSLYCSLSSSPLLIFFVTSKVTVIIPLSVSSSKKASTE